jgi:hypothetical protein
LIISLLVRILITFYCCSDEASEYSTQLYWENKELQIQQVGLKLISHCYSLKGLIDESRRS